MGTLAALRSTGSTKDTGYIYSAYLGAQFTNNIGRAITITSVNVTCKGSTSAKYVGWISTGTSVSGFTRSSAKGVSTSFSTVSFPVNITIASGATFYAGIFNNGGGKTYIRRYVQSNNNTYYLSSTSTTSGSISASTALGSAATPMITVTYKDITAPTINTSSIVITNSSGTSSSTDKYVKVSWTASNGTNNTISKYYYTLRNSSGTSVKSGNTTSTSVILGPLDRNTTYYCEIQAAGSAGINSPTIKTSSVTIKNYTAPVVNSISLKRTDSSGTSSSTDTCITATWTSTNGLDNVITGYSISIYSTSISNIIKNVQTTNKSYTFTGLSEGTTYYCLIQALAPHGNSDTLRSSNLTLDMNIPQAVTFEDMIKADSHYIVSADSDDSLGVIEFFFKFKFVSDDGTINIEKNYDTSNNEIMRTLTSWLQFLDRTQFSDDNLAKYDYIGNLTVSISYGDGSGEPVTEYSPENTHRLIYLHPATIDAVNYFEYTSSSNTTKVISAHDSKFKVNSNYVTDSVDYADTISYEIRKTSGTVLVSGEAPIEGKDDGANEFISLNLSKIAPTSNESLKLDIEFTRIHKSTGAKSVSKSTLNYYELNNIPWIDTASSLTPTYNSTNKTLDIRFNYSKNGKDFSSYYVNTITDLFYGKYYVRYRFKNNYYSEWRYIDNPLVDDSSETGNIVYLTDILNFPTDRKIVEIQVAAVDNILGDSGIYNPIEGVTYLKINCTSNPISVDSSANELGNYVYHDGKWVRLRNQYVWDNVNSQWTVVADNNILYGEEIYSQVVGEAIVGKSRVNS